MQCEGPGDVLPGICVGLGSGIAGGKGGSDLGCGDVPGRGYLARWITGSSSLCCSWLVLAASNDYIPFLHGQRPTYTQYTRKPP